ncbi:MAG: ubiquinol-cytochrome c reductase iron-sulfur subunit, partial [Actinomycetota bacterium]
FLVYLTGGQPQLEGAFLGLALGGLAVALGLWAEHLMPSGHESEERDRPGDPEVREEAEEAFEAGAQFIERRRFLTKLLGGAIGALGLAGLFPIRSLGVAPGRLLFGTAWRKGSRLVRADGTPVRAADVEVDGFLTVFPEFNTEAADAQTVLIRLPPEAKAPGPQGWSQDGFVGFSKICTHAGCPVGLYQAESKELFCPCHQSTFAVLEGAKPTEGPATRPLPQLPVGIDGEGFLVAGGDFEEPVGPGFWNRIRGDR